MACERVLQIAVERNAAHRGSVTLPTPTVTSAPCGIIRMQVVGLNSHCQEGMAGCNSAIEHTHCRCVASRWINAVDQISDPILLFEVGHLHEHCRCVFRQPDF